MKNEVFLYIQVLRGVYMIWGHYIIENGISNLVLTLSNMVGPYHHPEASYLNRFKKCIFCVQKVAIFGHIWYAKK